MNRLHPLLAMILIVPAGSSPPARTGGRTFVIAPGGADQNPGTVLGPWRTLARALGSVQPGDTVFLREGEYPPGTLIKASGTRGKPIVFRNFPGERPRINGGGRSRFGLVLDGVRFVHVRGLEIREIKTPNPRARAIMHRQGAVLLRESSDCVIEGNVIVAGGRPGYTEEEPGATGVQLWSRHEKDGGLGCHRNLIRGNDISQCAYATHLRGPARKNLFEGNNWHDNNEMRSHSDGAKSESIDYDRNHPRKFVTSTLDLLKPEWAAHTPRENTFRFNICERNSDEGIDTWISVKNTIEYNLCATSGTVKPGDGHGFKLGPGGSNRVRFNISRGNRVAGYTNNAGRGNEFEGNFAYEERKGAGGDGVRLIKSEAEWKEKAGPIEKRIRDFHAGLVESAPPNPPREVSRTGKLLSWKAPTPARDGDTAACYLILEGDRVVGITIETSFKAPAGARGPLSVAAVDDSLKDNRSEAVRARE